MAKSLQRNLQGFVLAVLALAIASIICFWESNMVLANTRTPRQVQAKAAITGFLSSVELGERSYEFDHNGDGISDTYVYPLITSRPDFKTKYVTLEEAAKNKQVILKENVRNRSLNKKDPPSSYDIVAQVFGSSYGYGSRSGFGSRLGFGTGYGYGSSTYYPRGGMTGGGWQSRGLPRGGILGSSYGPSGYRSYPGGYGPYGKSDLRDDDFKRSDFRRVVALGEFDFADAKFRPGQNLGSPEPAEKTEVEVKALCFEKWRLIEESRRTGDSEYFSYVGMASPYVRKELVLFPNQVNVDKIIARELRELGVRSRTGALADVFKNEDVKRIIDYYKANSKKILGKNKNVSGMIVTSRNRILSADVYSSPVLFRKMLSQLMQSAALGVSRADARTRKHIADGDVEKFWYDLKQIQKLKKENSQTYRLFYPKIIGAAELYPDKNITNVVHLEAYPR